MQVIGDMERERDIKVAAVSTVDPKHLISHPSLIHTFDLSTLTLEQTELSQAFELALLPDQVQTNCTMHAGDQKPYALEQSALYTHISLPLRLICI